MKVLIHGSCFHSKTWADNFMLSLPLPTGHSLRSTARPCLFQSAKLCGNARRGGRVQLASCQPTYICILQEIGFKSQSMLSPKVLPLVENKLSLKKRYSCLKLCGCYLCPCGAVLSGNKGCQSQGGHSRHRPHLTS